MNVFLHDFKTLEDFNDVAEWIKSSGLDPEKNTILFAADLAESDMNGMLLIGSTISILAHIAKMTVEVIANRTEGKAHAVDMLFALYKTVYEKLSARLSEEKGLDDEND